MKKRPWLKWIGIILCVAMTIIIAIIFARVRRANEAERAELRRIAEEYEETMRPLWEEKARLEHEITEQEKVVAEEAPPSPVILLCTEPSADTLVDVYPIVQDYRYPAALVLWEDDFPGEKGCMTVSDALDLCDNGWELCLGVDADTDIAALYARVTEAGLPAPVAVYNPNNDMTAKKEKQVLSLGIQTVICYGKSVPENDTDGLWYLSAYGSSESDAKTTFQAKVRDAMPQALTVGFNNSYELFSELNFGNMVKTINSYEKSEDVIAMGIQDACKEYMRSQDSAFSRPETEAERHLRELQEALDDVNAKIWNLEGKEK